MKHPQTIFFLIVTGLLFCNIESTAQQVDNTMPMYGEVPKNEEYKKLDEDFKKACLVQFKTIDSSVFVQIDNAWRYYYHNDLKTAMKRFNQAWLLNPEFADAYFGFAALTDMQGNKTEAERFYKLGLAKDPKKVRASICYRRIAECKEQLQDAKGAIEAYTKISEIKITDAFAFKKIGYLQMQIGNADDALKAYGKAIELDGTDAVTYNNRAYLYQGKKSYTHAISDYSKAIELDSTYISAYVNRGITEVEMKNYEAAKKDFEICVKLDSKAGELRRFLGLTQLNLKNKPGACRNFELAKQLGDPEADGLIKENCK